MADEVRSDAMPDAAGGEGGHGVAKPDRITEVHFKAGKECAISQKAAQIRFCGESTGTALVPG